MADPSSPLAQIEELAQLADNARLRLIGRSLRAVTDLVALDGSNQAAVTFETDDLDALKAMLESMPPDVAAQAELHGVIPPFTVYVER